MYQYKNACFSTPELAYQSIAADCLGIASDGQSLDCVPVLGGVEVTKSDGVSTLVYTYSPTLQDCTIDFDQIGEFSMLPSLVLATAFGLMMLKRMIK